MIGFHVDSAKYAMLFSHPAYRYARTVQRDDAATVRRIEA